MQMTLPLFFYFIIHIVFDFELSAVIYEFSLFLYMLYTSYVCLYLSSLYVVTS